MVAAARLTVHKWNRAAPRRGRGGPNNNLDADNADPVPDEVVWEVVARFGHRDVAPRTSDRNLTASWTRGLRGRVSRCSVNVARAYMTPSAQIYVSTPMVFDCLRRTIERWPSAPTPKGPFKEEKKS